MKKIFCLLFTFYATTLFTVQLTPNDFEPLKHVPIEAKLFETVQLVADLKKENINDFIFELLQAQNPSLIRLILYLFEKIDEGLLTRAQGFNDKRFVACDCIGKVDRIFFALTLILQTIQTIGQEPFEYASLGSGLFLQDYIILIAYKDLDMNCQSIQFIDPIYDGKMNTTFEGQLLKLHEPRIEHLKEKLPDKQITTYLSADNYKPSELANKVMIMSDPDPRKLTEMVMAFNRLKRYKGTHNTITAMISKNGTETRLSTSLIVNDQLTLLVAKDCKSCAQ